MIIFKKEYRVSLFFILVFGLFLFTIDQSSAQIVSYFTNTNFRYEQPAFLKLIYLLILVITLSSLASLHKNETISSETKKKTFQWFVYFTALSFFPGWIIHLFVVIRTLQNGGSFMLLENQFWWYHSTDITFVIGFVFAGLTKMRPAIHSL